MVQQQLVDYIKSQLKLGAGRDSIKSALTGAGWPQADVEDSLSSAEALAGPSSALPVASSIRVSDLIPNDKLEVAAAVAAESKPKAAASAEAVKPKKEKSAAPFKLNKSLIIIIALAVLFAASAAGAAFFYFKNDALENKLTAATNDVGAEAAKTSSLNSQVAGLTKTKDDLSTKVSGLQSENDDLKSTLTFFLVPLGAATSSELTTTLKGTLALGRTQYYLMTPGGLTVYVKNSKDTKVDALLKPLVGGAVEISGTHAAGSRDVTVTSVNGALVQ